MTTGTIPKMMLILHFAADHGMQWKIRTLSSELKIPRSTVHRLCKILANNGILAYDSKIQEYRWGPDMIRIAQSIYQGTDFRGMALPILRMIVDRCNESAILTLYDRPTRKVIFTDQVQCDQPIRYHIPIGAKLPIHAGASGTAILAFLPEEEIEEILASGLERVTNRTVVSPDRLRKQLAAIRLKGYAISHGERTPGAVGIASPIFNANSGVIGCLMVTIPSYRFRPRMESSIRLLVQGGAVKLSHLLGGPPASDAEKSSAGLSASRGDRTIDPVIRGAV
jgi:IclR family acetate operon transcriptional repressor